MIRQPEFLATELFQQFLADVKFGSVSEGLCCQILHIGSYDDEPASFAMMDEFCKANGYKRISNIHREIYLKDPRKTEINKLNTVLRYEVHKGAL